MQTDLNQTDARSQPMLAFLRTPAMWMVGASLAFASMSACIKLAADHGVSIGNILFYRGAVALVLMAAYLRLRGIPLATPHWKAHAARGLIGLTSLFLYVTAIVMLPLATAVTLNYISPLVLALVLVVIYREHAHPAMIFAMLGGLTGIVLLLQPTIEASQWLGGAIAIASAVTSAMVALNVRRLGKLNEPPARTVAYFSLIITLATAPSLLFGGSAPLTLESVGYVVGTGVLATVGQFMLTLAYQRGQTLLASLLGYSQVVFTSLLTMLIWNDSLSLLSWAGMTLVVASGATALLSMRPQPKLESGPAQ